MKKLVVLCTRPYADNTDMSKKILFFPIVLAFFTCAVYAQPTSRLFISPEDVRLEQDGSNGFDGNAGFHLYIRKKPGISSVLLTETTRDPAGVESNYAYRALEWNAINGNERRMLNGNILDSDYSRYSLIDSTTEPDEIFGEAFHIFIPRTITYGYEWTRHGTIEINRWTFINIRAFELPYADYAGGFLDNPFMFDLGAPVVMNNSPVETPEVVEQEKEDELPPSKNTEEIVEAEKEVPVLTDDYNPEAGKKFDELADFMIYSKGPETIIEDIMQSISKINPKGNADIAFVIDSTGSMKDDIEMLRKKWIPILLEGLKEFEDVRLGLILYRDYGEAGYNYKRLPVKFFDFTSDTKVFSKNLNNFTILGHEGGDVPEAVYEGLYSALEFYKWRSDAARKIILIGDAEPHPVPRGTGKYTKQLVQDMAAKKNIEIDAIIVPDNKSDRGR